MRTANGVLCLAAVVVVVTLVSKAFAGGSFNPQEARAGWLPQSVSSVLQNSAAYNGPGLRVSQSDLAGASVTRTGGRIVALGYGRSETVISSGSPYTSWKKTVERGSASAVNGNGSATGFSATFLKIETADGQFFMYKGYSSAGAALDGNRGSTSSEGFGQSVAGRLR
jgi:hypothetical protein